MNERPAHDANVLDVNCDVRRATATQTLPLSAVQAKLLHDLNNVLVAILLNTQIIQWKLPSYSRIKRNLHEVERNAQRGGLLVTRLRAILSGGTGQCQSEAEIADMGVGSQEGAGKPG